MAGGQRHFRSRFGPGRQPRHRLPQVLEPAGQPVRRDRVSRRQADQRLDALPVQPVPHRARHGAHRRLLRPRQRRPARQGDGRTDGRGSGQRTALHRCRSEWRLRHRRPAGLGGPRPAVPTEHLERRRAQSVQLDEVTLTNFEEQVPDRQSNVCRVCTPIDDADAAVGYRSGWHRVSSPVASGGGYHRHMGSGSNSVARVVFTGDQITYFFARSSAGGTADVFIDGTFKGTVSYFSASLTPTFGHSVAYSGLGAGSHELRIEPRSGAVYVDGFEFCSGGGADASAVQYRSVTQTSTGTLGLTPITRTVQMGPNDEEISVVVEGMAAPLTVQLLSSSGSVIASGGAILPGFTASGFNKAVPAPGTYTVKVLNSL